MTVQELIDDLMMLDPQMQVILSKDSEGNYFSPLSYFNLGAFQQWPDANWYGDYEEGVRPINPDEKHYAVVCLWPEN